MGSEFLVLLGVDLKQSARRSSFIAFKIQTFGPWELLYSHGRVRSVCTRWNTMIRGREFWICRQCCLLFLGSEWSRFSFRRVVTWSCSRFSFPSILLLPPFVICFRKEKRISCSNKLLGMVHWESFVRPPRTQHPRGCPLPPAPYIHAERLENTKIPQDLRGGNLVSWRCVSNIFLLYLTLYLR